MGLNGLKVVVDTGNGAAAEASPRALRRMGAQVLAIHSSPDGYNINEGCGSTHLADLREARESAERRPPTVLEALRQGQVLTIVADGAKAKGALLRDVSAYLITAAVVGYVVGVRQRVTAGTVALLLGGYGAFVAIVLAAELAATLDPSAYARTVRAIRGPVLDLMAEQIASDRSAGVSPL